MSKRTVALVRVNLSFRILVLVSVRNAVFSLYIRWNSPALLLVRGITVERNVLVLNVDVCYRKKPTVLVFTVMRVRELCIALLPCPWAPRGPYRIVEAERLTMHYGPLSVSELMSVLE